MVGKVLNIQDVILPDRLGTQIAIDYQEKQTLRSPKMRLWEEIRQYVYATDTKTTTNSKLPWKNSTTIPKLCNIRDNLIANYMAALFPKRIWLDWLADDRVADQPAKRQAILAYMTWAVSQPSFKEEILKCLMDYIDYGNAIAMPIWTDESQVLPNMQQKVGYVGPAIQRVSPVDIVCNPTAPSWRSTPKIVRTITSLGEVKKILESQSTDENRDAYEKLFTYLKDIRTTIQNFAGDLRTQDMYYNVDGFTSFRAYMLSDYVEILTFYGDIYDWETGTFLENHQIMVVDRHKVISKKPNPSFFGTAPIFHVGWRARQDNLWAMGPLDNLVGMQYRIDHTENSKADILDTIGYPVFKVKGYVEDFEWGPLERIHMDNDSDVDVIQPPYQVLQLQSEIAYYMQLMEEMAGSPKEAMGFRTPGEKTAYEVQRLENAAARIFQAKIVQFEESFLEPLMNGMLELARRNMNASQTVNFVDDQFDIQVFMTLTPADITGAGRLKPIAARHFAEEAELIQNLTNFANSPLGQDPGVIRHISGLGTAHLFEKLLHIEEYGLVRENVRLAEDADAERLAAAHQEKVGMEAQTPAGLQPDDHDPELDQVPEIPMQMESM